MALSKIQTAEMLDTPNLGRRNLVVNGGTLIWQRATGATTSANAQIKTCDRVMGQFSHGGATTTERSTDVPAGQGFQYSLKHVVTTADASMGADDYYDIYQTRLEGNDVARLCYATSSAKKTSLSFWIKSSVAGVYNGTILAHTAKIKLPFNFTISSADTWQHIKIENLPGATAGADDGTAWVTSGNNLGLTIRIFGMLGSRWTGATDRTWNTANDENAYGSSNSQVNWMGTLSNTLYITGMQFEVGDTSTDFEHRSFAEELELCQRYYEQGSFSWRQSGSIVRIGQNYHTRKRANATVNVYYDGNKATAGTINVNNSNNSGWNEGGNTNFWNMEKNIAVNSDSIDYNCFWTSEAEI